MKRLFAIIAMVSAMLAVSANSVHYFTAAQANRVVRYLNQQNELMIYCGYEDELESYILVNEVWSERVNSRYFEVWLFGYDAYTGEEVFMPIDLDCIWLLRNTHLFNAATYLRFRNSAVRPDLVWTMPVYNPFTRIPHPAVYTCTYHYHVHRYGWVRPLEPHFQTYVIHEYYMRRPIDVLPIVVNVYTPGREKPVINRPAQVATSNGQKPSAQATPAPATRPRPVTTARTQTAAATVTSYSAGTSSRPTSSASAATSDRSSSSRPATSTATSTSSTRSTSATSRPATSTSTSTSSTRSTSATSRPATSTATSTSSTRSTSATSRPATSTSTTTTSTRSTSATSRPATSTATSTSSTRSTSTTSRPATSTATSSSSTRSTSTTSRPATSTSSTRSTTSTSRPTTK